jgi:hypothetical protein
VNVLEITNRVFGSEVMTNILYFKPNHSFLIIDMKCTRQHARLVHRAVDQEALIVGDEVVESLGRYGTGNKRV